ncbi:antitoxin family protein [Thermococcus henrietii]|uniref:antitoxin family protein n=1 Tax=Thermococcus henrietii TaxID=2016361 RepID=UPI000C071AC4|nr:antitoxin family protein [Thermococcus henrietii]
MAEIIEAVYENGVLKPLKKLNLPEHARVRIVVTPDIDEILDSMLIRKVEKIDYKRLKEAYYESL